MVRLTYVLEPSAQAGPGAQPVNLAFAAAAAARASWASKERDESLWDFEPLDDGAPGTATLPSDDGLDVSFFFGGARVPDAAPAPAPPAPLSRMSMDIGGVLGMAGASLSAVDGPDIHNIPRNSVLYRTHAAQQTMTSSLPPAEPNAPSALEVASVMEDRKSRGIVQLPSSLLRSASFSPGIEAAIAPANGAGVEMRDIAESGTGSIAGGNGTPPFAKASYKAPSYTAGSSAMAAASTAALGALSSPGGGGVSCLDDGLDGDCDGERDGCLVLPVLRTLLAMQDEGPPRLVRNGTHGLSNMMNMNPSHHGGANHGLTATNGGGGNGGGNGGNYGNGNTLSRQPSMGTALRGSTSSALNHGLSGVGGVVVLSGAPGGGLNRQGTLGNGSPARRRVAGPDSPMLVGRASRTMKRQPSSIRPILVQNVMTGGGGGGGSPAQPSDDEDPFDAMGRTMSYTAATSLMSPLPSFGQHSRHATRAPSGLGVVPAAATVVGTGGADSSLHGGNAFFHGGVGVGVASPSERGRQNGGGGRVGAGIKQVVQQQPQPQALQQQQAHQVQPQVQQQPQHQQQADQVNAVGKAKSGKALFAWTNKLGKGKWPWFPGSSGGGGGAATAATASSAESAAAAAAAAVAAASLNQELLLGLSSEGALSRRGSIGSIGRVSGGGSRTSLNGGNFGPRSPTPGSAAPSRDSLQLPPIEYYRKSGLSTGPYSPLVTGLDGEPGSFGAAAMARALYESGMSIPARRA